MLDQPYWVLFPWLVFAVLDRVDGTGVGWAAFAAAAGALAIGLGSLRTARVIGMPNVLAWGALVWFVLLTIAAAVGDDSGFVAHESRALAAAGFAVVACSPLFEPRSPSSIHDDRVRRHDQELALFRHANFVCTATWVVAWSAIAGSQVVGATLAPGLAHVILYTLVPIVIIMTGAQRRPHDVGRVRGDRL